MASYYSNDHLNKPLPPPLTASPAPMDDGRRANTLPSRHDTTTSSNYSQRGNTLPVSHSQYPQRQDTYGSDVYSNPTAYAGARSPAPQGSVYSDPPDYIGHQHLGTQQPQHSASPVSPFDTVFDDPYPPKSLSSSRQNLTGQDRTYSGASAQSPSDDPLHANAIPLQDRSPKDPTDDTDHVYEAPRRHKSKSKSKKPGVKFGELGMVGAYGNRIPWVVYIFTAAQVGVFIGEIIKNGKPLCSLG